MELLCGAGFASGKEIYVFFAQFKGLGVVGAVFSSIIIGSIIYKTFRICKIKNIKSNNDFINEISKSKNEKIYKFNKALLKNIINIFLLFTFFTMMAGFCSYFKQEFNISIIISGVIVAVCVYIVFLRDIEGIMKVCSVIIPALIIITVAIVFTKPLSINLERTANEIFPSFTMAILYASYNGILLIPIIISASKFVKNEKSNKIIAIVSSLIIGVLALGIINLISAKDVKNFDLPVAKVLEKNALEGALYSVVLVIAIFSSALSAGYGVICNIKNRKTYKKVALAMCALGIAASYIGFGNLVSILYPLFGLVSIIQVILIEKYYRSIAK